MAAAWVEREGGAGWAEALAAEEAGVVGGLGQEGAWAGGRAVEMAAAVWAEAQKQQLQGSQTKHILWAPECAPFPLPLM